MGSIFLTIGIFVTVSTVSNPDLVGIIMIYFCIYAGVITSAYYMGYKKRRADRTELTGGQSG